MTQIKYNKDGVLCGVQTLEMVDGVETITSNTITQDFDCDDGLEWQDTDREVVNDGGRLYFADELKSAQLREAIVDKQSKLDEAYHKELSECTVNVELSTGKTLTLSTAQSTLQTLGTALTMVQYGNGFDWVGDDGKTYKLSTVDDVIACIQAISNHNTSVSKQWAILQSKINKCKTRKALDKIVIDLHEENKEVNEDETE